MADNVRIVIADGHEIIREAIAMRLREECGAEIVGEASDGYTCLKECRQEKPDILMTDLSITRPNGAETLARARKANPDMKIIILSSDASVANAFFCLSQGAIGFMPKQAKGMDFVNAVRAASNGYAYLPIEFLNEFVSARRNMTRTGNIFGLSPREVEILEACTSGQSTKEVAQALSISVRTVETHRNNIYRKTSCNSHQELTKIMSSMAND
ncbi:MAG: response regulator transcription factor [Sulfitobacter sp.]